MKIFLLNIACLIDWKISMYGPQNNSKPSAWTMASGFWNMKPEPWAVTGLSDGLWWPRLPTARHGQLKALSLSHGQHITNSICHNLTMSQQISPETIPDDVEDLTSGQKNFFFGVDL
jgi:hypothetical protein